MLNPNCAQGSYAAVFTQMMTGNAPSTFAALGTSPHLSPFDLYGIDGVCTQTPIQQEDQEAAAGWADRAAITPGAHNPIATIALVVDGLAGRHD